ncbi:methyltransferase domain-containing protein [Tianweitania sp. BSSL-BM11]|uniref:Methyltransferase domain-containing protein n=1 Tax=Tianweitania aestuarii TaxID=2814886 RepID=A0ABS5RZJ2_9HYPH|nr:methyltransferase domain-containing protein [Tianweitania aestuarii]MBS9722407.1 methyltransferase domain-containing protein [Tianweitania aestuarii]
MEPIVDTALSLQHKRRALLGGPAAGVDFLMRLSADDLSERLATVDRRFADAATLFSLTGHAAAALQASGKVDHVTRVEALPELLEGSDGRIAAPETVPLEPESMDLIVSLLSLHEANDIPGTLIQIRRALRPDGLFLAAFPGAGTLAEMRDSFLQAEAELSGGASPRVLPFADVRDGGGLLQRAGFALPVADLETLTVRYDNLFALMKDLRAMGAANPMIARARKPASMALFMRASEIYAERYSDPDGRIRATFSIVWLSGWAPHASQQKPAARGSATASLAEALKPR